MLRIWRQVLRFEDVGAGDDFFELGGDSILAIQIVTRAYRAGLFLTPRDVFEHPTVAALAAVAAPRAARPAVAAREPAGPSPLTPVQCWFFFDARFPEPWHFNQSMLLELRRPLSPAVLAAAVDRLLRHHDVLRSRFEGTAAHGWRQVFGARQAPSPTVGIDLSRLAAAGRHLALETAAARLQASLDLGRGPLARFGYFDLGRGRPPRLLIAVHHLVVDAVSWSILLTDLERVCRRLARGRAGGLPPKTTSYQTWAELQAEHATSAELERELEYWTAVPGGSPLPRDVPGGANTVGSAEVVSIALDAATTRRLLRSAPAAYRTRIDDLLLTALGRALGPWAGAVTVDLESHGREEEVFPGVDLSRTVGWFTSTFPVHLDLAGVDDPGEALMTVKETLRRIPRQGIGYGMLRYLSGAAVRLPTNVELSFNYLGQLDALLAGSELFAPAAEPRGAERSRRGMRSYVFEVDGGVVGGRLWIHWQFSHHLHRRETVERLAGAYRRELEELVAHCLAPGSGGVTPSDFPLAGLGRGALERLALERDVEDLYPLSPVQQGMLFHALLAPGTAVYLEQSSWALAGDLDERALRRAWQRLAARHAILRTAFVWEGLDRPLQVVRRRVELPWRLEDWRDAGVAEQEKRLETLFRRERERGFDLGRAPLARLVLVRLGDRRHRLLWSVHHLLLDGWSIAALFDELFEIYGALRRRREPDLAPRRPLRDFIAWLERRDPAAAEAFWRRELAGFTAPTRVAGAPPGGAARGAAGPGREVAEARRRLDAGTTAALKSLAKRRRVTLATVLQGAWAWVLSRHAGSDDVVFGATVAGRPADLPGADSIIGLLINTLPVRVRPDPDQPLPPWLARLQAQSLARQAHEHTPLVDVQAWSEVPPQLPLFDSLLVFENYPAEVPLEAEQRRGGLEIGDFRGYSHTHYPLTLGVLPGVGLTLEASFDPARIETLAALRLLRQLETVLAATAAGAGRTLGDLSVLSAAERHQLRFEWSGPGAVGAAAACVHERIEAFVARTPDAAAVVSEADDRDADGGGLVVTYGELGRRVSRLAGFLRALGVGPESRVGLALDRSPDIVVAILAVLSAGGAYVPLDPAHPRRRLAAMLAGSGVTLLVARGTAFAGAGVPVLDVDAVGAFGSSVAVPASVDSSPSVSRAGLAYVLHTSGSTGAPKGVMISHGALLDTLAAWEHDYRLRRVARRHLQVAAFTFDVASGDLVRALGTGATLVLSPCAALLAPRRLAELLRRQRVDAVELVPALAELLAEHLEREGERLEGLRLLAVGSDAWRMDALDRLARVAGRRARLISSYGVTEATVDSTFFDPRGSAAGAALAGERSVPIGRALAGRRLYVLDRRLAPVAAGVPGQLCLGGTGLARGYAGRPAATAERFVPDPFRAGGGAGRRLYLTGDRARHLSDGQLELSGRLDQQLKLRGVRVEPGEVEAALRRHPAVREAVVVGGEDAAGERVLAAFLVPEPGAGEIRPEAARRFLARRLPAPMVPSAFVTLRALPLSRNGKVDRAALGRNVLPRAAGGAAWEAPATPAEKRLAEIFTRVLGVGRVGRRDDFFQLGGHSLKAVRLMVEIERHFGVRLPLATLFRGPVLADLAPRIAAPAAPKASRILVEIARGNGAPPFFCVHPVGGHVLCYVELARHLGVEHPVYGLQSPGAAGLRGRPLTGVGAMARRYLEAIREARPRGPYLLGGWSMGGVVAFEIARQLSRRGEEVAAVVVIDCAVPGSPSAAAVDRVPSLEAFAEDLGIDPPPPVAALPPTEALRRILDEGIQRGVLDRQIRRRELERLYRLFAANDRAMKRYRPGRYDGRVALFRSAHWDGDPTLGWSRVARRVDVRVVGGDHATMVREPHVRGLAAMLRAQLADALCATRA